MIPMLKIKIDPTGGSIVSPGALVRRGEFLGVSPFFDHPVLCPVDGWVKEVKRSAEEPSEVVITITPLLATRAQEHRFPYTRRRSESRSATPASQRVKI